MPRHLYPRPALIALVLLVPLYLSAPAWAQRVEQELTDGLPVHAEYLPGSTQKPALLVMHGFLQTYDFMATQNIVNGLAALDYAVLAPNLSLGVPNRRQSMQCNAPHTHTFDNDLAEMNVWIDWLRAQGYKSIILVGHSWGSQHSLGYKLKNPTSPVIATIAISLVRTHQTADVQHRQIQQARALLEKNAHELMPYELSFCKEFMATPASYLSYAVWDDKKVLEVLASLQEAAHPVYVILGGADKRIDQKWQEAIAQRVTSLVEIEGANHFFSHVSEFELNDQLEKILPKIVN